MWIDTHCHLDAAEFASEEDAVAARAQQQAVNMIVIPAVARDNFSIVETLAHRNANCTYALGIHPIYVPQAKEEDLAAMRSAVASAMNDPRFVAIGEIGLDFFVPTLTTPVMREKQEFFYTEQLKIAREYGLPVLLHVRKSQDTILKYLRRINVIGGIAHAFNGSFQQAEVFIELGFKLGFGGAMTFTRALQLRRLATMLPIESLVLETDAPDISPAWVHPQRNSPEQLPRIGQVLAELRDMPIAAIAQITSANALAAMPRLGAVI
ncbi:TatD family hydrolase [Herminiimonas aquatilis]|uniref:TatD family hydrolase n=1 Tax=Herminiimonas aquatilis TaxID=345342 RepID=A0ABW2J295_9BURK